MIGNLYFKFMERKHFKKELEKIMIKLGKDPKEDAYVIILDALLKRIPKEINEYEDNDGDDDDGKPIIRSFYRCPSCDKIIYHVTKYCSNCGQRLDFNNVWR